MFRTFSRRFLPNPFDAMLKKTAKRGGRKILLGWNRGLGDLALGLYAMIHRIYEIIPDAQITFITRENLREGFSMLPRLKTLFTDWKRGEKGVIDSSIKSQYDLVIEEPSPTDWVYWQRGKITPKLYWNEENEALFERFNLSNEFTYIGVQVVAETQYGLWRNWPSKRWQELFDRVELARSDVKFILFGFGNEIHFSNQNIIDLRGKTSLFELLSIVKNRCSSLILPDSGIASMVYYLDVTFPIDLITLWADPNHGILKQAVSSPNQELQHHPLIANERDLSKITVDHVLSKLFPVEKVATVLLAGGQGTRLGVNGAKGLFSIEGKTLFQIFSEKMPKGSTVAVQTSPFNHEETVAYFKKHQNFGLDLYFFQQEMDYLLDENKNQLDKLASNGNGSVFYSLCKAALHLEFIKKGIDIVSVCYIENPLANPLDPLFISKAKKHDVTLQCIKRLKTDQFMGAVEENRGKIKVVEYTELDPKKNYHLAYSGQMAFSLPFFIKASTLKLPIHWVQKMVDGKKVWKGEKFIFDVLPLASSQAVVEVPRKTHYAPIKSQDCVESVSKQMRECV